MEREELEAEISLLVDAMEGEQGDRHEIYLRLRQAVGGMQAMGMPVPEDIAALLRAMEADFEADRAGADEARARRRE